ncbi:MAG: SpoIIE family protein phosphatase [Tissierellia bacterium]|nr:SpoIIE family protein phosphatase [Tissierellia bacterium]
MHQFNLIDIENNLAILDFIPDWVKITDLFGRIVYANKALREELNFDPQGMFLESLSVVHESDIFKSPRPLTEKEKNHVHSANIHYDGRYFNVVSAPITDNQNVVTAIVEVYRDVTAERKVEYALKLHNENLSRDLQLTKKIQQSILPRNANLGPIDFKYFYTPCEPLSGDIFDVVPIGRNVTSAYVCDVAGHGVAAAMVTVFVRETMRSLEDFHSSAYDLKQLHRRFLNLGLDMDQYLTMFHVLIDTKENTLSYSNAGHNCPMFFIRGRDVETITISGKPVTALFETIDFKENILRFYPGDKILLLTDGILEARNQRGEEFGIERIISEIKKNPDQILESLKKAIYMFSGDKQEDDMCALLIHYKGEE